MCASYYVCKCEKIHNTIEEMRKCELTHQTCPWCKKTVSAKTLASYPRFRVYQCPKGHKFAGNA